VARPIVESYIAENIGPRALLRDLAKTARVIARFGPKLPQIADAALTRHSVAPVKAARKGVWPGIGWMGAGAALTLVVMWSGGWL
jgi:ubiquinone biosynthesis protein